MNQELQNVSSLMVLTQNYILPMLPLLQVLRLCACMCWETKHNLKIIIPAWSSMMMIIPVWKADRTEKKLCFSLSFFFSFFSLSIFLSVFLLSFSEERRSSCWNCLKRGWFEFLHSLHFLCFQKTESGTSPDFLKIFPYLDPLGQLECWDVYSEIWLFHN